MLLLGTNIDFFRPKYAIRNTIYSDQNFCKQNGIFRIPFIYLKKKIDTSKIRRKVFNCFMYKIKNGEIYRRKKK